MKKTNEFRLTLDARSVNEGFARVAVSAFAAPLDPTLEELADLKTAVSEAVTNCIVHGYKDCCGKIYIHTVLLDPPAVRVTVRDKGCGIADVPQAMTPLYTTGEGERAGLGFTVMESFCDKLRVTSKPGRGTTVVLEKRITGKLVVFCNAPEDNPFMAGAFHGVSEPDCVINVGVSGPGVVRAAVAKFPDYSINDIAELIKKTAFKVTRMGQLVGVEASRRLGVPFGIVDLSLAPTPAVGDSVAHILEEIGLEKCGGAGTTACLAMLNDAVKKGGVMASSSVGGLSGAFIPVSEDAGMIDAARCGALTIEKLEAMTAVCSVGLDMIVIPGDTTPEVISGIIADEAAIGMVNCKTTAVRVIPAIGKQVGDELEFGGLLGAGPVMKVNTGSPAKFINRGGKIPAPLHSLKN